MSNGLSWQLIPSLCPVWLFDTEKWVVSEWRFNSLFIVLLSSIITRLMLCRVCPCLYRYGFGSEGKPEYKIGPDKDIIYEVTLKDFQRVSPAFYCFQSKEITMLWVWFWFDQIQTHFWFLILKGHYVTFWT